MLSPPMGPQSPSLHTQQRDDTALLSMETTKILVMQVGIHISKASADWLKYCPYGTLGLLPSYHHSGYKLQVNRQNCQY